MTAIKSSDVDRFIAKPDPALPIVLVFGPDAGLVRERVDALVRASVDDPNDPFALARIEGEELSGNPSRLVEEAHTVPLFGGRRAVLVKAGARNIAAAVETVINAPSNECRVIIEAGDLRKNAPLRALCEKAKVAAALPCYIDNAQAIFELDRRRDARGQADARARRTRRAGAIARRRPPGFAQRDAQARAIRQGRERIELDDVMRGDRGRLGAGARRRHRCRLRRQHRRRGDRIRQGARERRQSGGDHFGIDPPCSEPA